VPVPLLLVLDGNNLLHRAYHAAPTGRLLDRAGRPVWALKGLVGYVARAAAQVRPDAVMVGFDCPEHSARMAAWLGYKAQRGEKPGDLAEQIASAPALLRAAGRIRGRRRPCQRGCARPTVRLAIGSRDQRPGRVRAA
jgi:5'-3' exonuclease